MRILMPYTNSFPYLIPLILSLINLPLFGPQTIFSLFGFIISTFLLFIYTLASKGFKIFSLTNIDYPTAFIFLLVVYVIGHFLIVGGSPITVLFWMAVLIFRITMNFTRPAKNTSRVKIHPI